MSIHFCKINFT